MCDSEAEKILFILNKHERAYRRLIPVYIFLAIVLWILPILLIVYLYFCIVDNAQVESLECTNKVMTHIVNFNFIDCYLFLHKEFVEISFK